MVNNFFSSLFSFLFDFSVSARALFLLKEIFLIGLQIVLIYTTKL